MTDRGVSAAEAVSVVRPGDRVFVGSACATHYLNPATGLADVAYMVDAEWQGAGLGSVLHRQLVDYARERGARGLTAEVLLRNARMMRIFERGEHSLRTRTEEGVLELTMLFE